MTVLSENEADQAQSGQTAVGPGALLRKERESQGLDQSRVAAQLHLSETMIEALEWDDIEAQPEAVFTQGYLRNYARLLGLPEAEILAAYQRVNPGNAQKQLTAKDSVKIKQEVRSSHALVQLTTWVIVIGLAALLFFWWQGRFGWQERPLDEVDSGSQSLDEQPLVEEQFEVFPDAAEPYPEPIDTPSQTDLPADVVQETRLQEGADISLTAPEPSASAEEVLPHAEADIEAPAVSAEQTPTQVAPAQAPAASEPAVNPQDGKLVFEFEGRCWAEVRDAGGVALIIGEKQAGYRRVIDANQGPFKVVLGNAKVVRITLNGKPYDLASHTRGVVARFTLDAEPEAAPQ
jgi:cytoskeleton protein RodZ